jgi:hypothetical protein
MTALANRDPNRHYVWVNPLDAMARGNYAMLGYTAETYTQDGVRPMFVTDVSKLLGKEIEGFAGSLLWSLDAQERARIEDEGIDGYGGQVAADERSERLKAGRRPAELAPVTGQGGRLYVDFKNTDDSASTEPVGG